MIMDLEDMGAMEIGGLKIVVININPST